jgi:hypothetical protein
MLLADIFNQSPFRAVQLTANINVVPNDYGRLQQLNLFPGEGVATTGVAVQYANGTLNLLPTRVRGGPPSLGLPEKRNVRIFNIPHIPHDDLVTSGDVQSIIALGGNVLENVEAVVNRKLLRMRRKHAITLEHLRMGALKGVILDADGSTIYNLFTEFGISETSISFVFGTNTTDIVAKCREVITHMEDNLNGEVMTGVHALCSPGFFSNLIGHATVKEAYKYYASAQNPLRDDLRRFFAFGGIVFEEYRGSANAVNENGTFTVRKFIPDNEARFFPVGTTETFATYFAPPDILTEANELGTEIYADQALDPEFGRWVKLHSQSNPLPLVKRPALLVRGTSA